MWHRGPFYMLALAVFFISTAVFSTFAVAADPGNPNVFYAPK